MTRRFDHAGGKKIHMQSLETITYVSYQVSALCSYERAARYMKEIRLVPRKIEQFYRKMVFNCLESGCSCQERVVPNGQDRKNGVSR